MNRETRAAGKIRVEDEEKRIYAARVVTYGPVDSHGTSWAPGVFAESLRNKPPKSVWSHDAQRPIGKVIDYRDSDEGLDVMVQFADFDAVPDARMAHSLLKDGIIDEFSFAFYRQADEPDTANPGATRITKALITEVSPVLTASGQGTGTLGVRSASVPRAEADELLRKVATGEMSAYDALTEMASMRAAPKIEVRCASKEDADAIQEFLESTGRQVAFVQSAENGAYVLEATVTTRQAEPPAEPPAQEPDTDVDAELRAIDAILNGEEY